MRSTRALGSRSGQVMIIFAVAMVVLVAFVGLVITAGLTYWQQRSLQTVADGAALAGSQHIAGQCTDAQARSVITAADLVLTANLGGGGSLSINPGACGLTSYVGTDTFNGSVTATIRYPYRPPWNTQVAVDLSRANSSIPFGQILGIDGDTVPGRAVAQHSLAGLPASFALVAAHGLSCQGSGGGNKIDVQGSIYAGPPTAGTQSINTTGNCAIYAHRSSAAGSTTDWGDILAYDDGQQWLGAAGACQPPAGGTPGSGVKASVCADGFELSGVANSQCASSYPPDLLSPPGSMFMDVNAIADGAPNPCDGEPPPVPALQVGQFIPAEPNLDPAATATLTNGPCSPTKTLTAMSFNWGVNGPYTGFGTGPGGITVDAGGYAHFKPGCYGYLDISALMGAGPHGSPKVAGALLEPGFYYFNGSGFGGSGGGLCIGGVTTKVLGQDMTLEFVNSTSFSNGSCSSTPTNACGASKACGFGSDPGSAPTDGHTWFSAPCSTATTTAQCPLGTTGSAWCSTSDQSCWNTLIWAPPPGLSGLTQIGGTFFVKGPSVAASYLFGNVFWPGPAGSTPTDNGAGCAWYSNSGGQLVGELICDTLTVQGGQSGGTVGAGYSHPFTSNLPRQIGLVE